MSDSEQKNLRVKEGTTHYMSVKYEISSFSKALLSTAVEVSFSHVPDGKLIRL
jgi:hypothetical protein